MSDDEKPRKPKPARPTPASEDPGLRGQRRRPDGPGKRGRGRKRESGRKSRDRGSAPTPVREAMDDPTLEPTPLTQFPGRSFQTEDGEGWVARVTGRSVIGHAPVGGGLIMHLSFSREDEPGTVARETLTPCESLDELTESELVRLLSGATANRE